jgi:hypothetical protein
MAFLRTLMKLELIKTNIMKMNLTPRLAPPWMTSIYLRKPFKRKGSR